jgi:hypothetical protein
MARARRAATRGENRAVGARCACTPAAIRDSPPSSSPSWSAARWKPRASPRTTWIPVARDWGVTRGETMACRTRGRWVTSRATGRRRLRAPCSTATSRVCGSGRESTLDARRRRAARRSRGSGTRAATPFSTRRPSLDAHSLPTEARKKKKRRKKRRRFRAVSRRRRLPAGLSASASRRRCSRFRRAKPGSRTGGRFETRRLSRPSRAPRCATATTCARSSSCASARAGATPDAGSRPGARCFAGSTAPEPRVLLARRARRARARRATR